MKRFLHILFLSLIATGCSAPLALKDEAAIHLQGSCLDMFLHPQYQTLAQSLGTQAAFALATDGKSHACAISLSSKDKIDKSLGVKKANEYYEALAIERCEEARIKIGLTAPCRIFARNNEIVWRKIINAGLQ